MHVSLNNIVQYIVLKIKVASTDLASKERSPILPLSPTEQLLSHPYPSKAYSKHHFLLQLLSENHIVKF